MSKLLRFDAAAAIRPGVGLEANEVARLGPRLEKLRDEICDIDEKMLAGEIAIPPSKSPLLTQFYNLPARSLAAYEANRLASELARLLAATKQLMAEVDRIVVLCDGDWSGGAKAVMQACCQPYFNELSRGQRGSRPRLYFADSLDNDVNRGLLYLLGGHREPRVAGIEDRWGLVIIGGSQHSQADVAIAPFLAALSAQCDYEGCQVSSRVIAVGCCSGWLAERVAELGASRQFAIPSDLGKLFSVMSAAGLVPAALLGVNIMKLQEGGRAVSEHFRDAKASENLVLQFAAVNHLMATRHSGYARVLHLWNHALAATGQWYERLWLGCLQRAEGIVPPACIQQQGSWGDSRRRFVIHVAADHFRFDPLDISAQTDAKAVGVAGEANLAHLSVQQLREFEGKLCDAGVPSARLQLPQVDETYLGQLMQLLMLATVVEARLLGLNPYQSAQALEVQ